MAPLECGSYWHKADIAQASPEVNFSPDRSSRTAPPLKIRLAAIGRLTRRQT